MSPKLQKFYAFKNEVITGSKGCLSGNNKN